MGGASIALPARQISKPQIRTLLAPFSDPRLLQIVLLGGILTAGAWLRDFSIAGPQILLTFGSALLTQYICAKVTGQNRIVFLSTIITALSLTILLRADNLWAHPSAASIAISSKFLVRSRGKHLFNPSCFGIVVALLAIPGTWISAGQWGEDIALAGWLVVLGALIANRARRGDISWSFLLFYLGAIALRVAWLGQRWAVLEHRLTSGALLLFAFFMISDPMTIPNDGRGRIAHAALVAAIAFVWTFEFYGNNGVVWALFVAAPAVVLWDRIWPAPKYEWR